MIKTNDRPIYNYVKILVSIATLVLLGSAPAMSDEYDRFELAAGGYVVVQYDSVVALTQTNVGVGISFSPRDTLGLDGEQALAEQLLGPLFSQLKAGIASQIERLTAEGDIVVAQTSGTAETTTGTPYDNTYCQVITIRDGQIAAVKEYMDTALIDSVFGAA